MKPFYLKGNYAGNPTFIMITSSPSRTAAEMISYNVATKKWLLEEKKFDLRDSEKKREYYNFLEMFFASNRNEYHTARKYLTKPPQVNSSPKKSSQPVITMEELIEKINQFEKSKGKSGDNNSPNSINNQQ